jgi:hypothetical protein
MEKHELILNKLINKRKSNDKYCDLNKCPPSPYMDESKF